MALERFTTYTELDENDHIEVSNFLLDVNGITTSEDAWVYKDMGAAHFGETFEHDVKVTIRTSDLESICVLWAVSNVVEDRYYWYENASQAVCLFCNYLTVDRGYRFILKNEETGAVDVTADKFISLDTPYYLVPKRTSDTSTSCLIYLDAAKTNLLDTLTVAITAGRTYEHIFACNSSNDGTGKAFSCDIENLNLNEPTPIPIFRHHYELLARR